MIIRKLEQSEHIATRKLWEEIFPEDTKAFLDYYYYIKAAKNQIYVVEEDGRICSMLQLNPYRIRLEDKKLSVRIYCRCCNEKKNIAVEDICGRC